MSNNTLIWLIILGVFFFVIFYFLFEIWRNRHTLVLRKVVNNKKVIQRIKFRPVIDGDGTEWYKAKGKLYKPAPANSIDVTKWGSIWVEAYENENGSITYIEDSHNDGAGFQPLTASDRRLLVQEIRKAESRKRFSIKESIPQLVSIGAAALIVIMLIVFWSDLAEPFQERDAMTISYAKIQQEQLEILKEIKLGIQRIENSKGNTGGGVIPD